MPESSEYTACLKGEAIEIRNNAGECLTAGEFLFSPTHMQADSFLLRDVVIGISFHWQQQEDQQFRGSLKLTPEDGLVRAVNVVPVEEYLCSVISSEMSAESSPGFLKAHAVISRSWLLAQLDKNEQIRKSGKNYHSFTQTSGELVRWYDREDHRLFDVCADDHCQRYQGISKIITDKARQAVSETSGEALVYNGKVCDARFSKCCGGVSESFETVWEPVHHPYLTAVTDTPDKSSLTSSDLRSETAADAWIRQSPPAFCNTSDQKILTQVLPGFDQKTHDFYRWKLEYSQEELAVLLKKKTGIDFGLILRLEALERGFSGRIVRLKITGTLKTMIIGKELEIRKALSETHLYSSAFVVDALPKEKAIPEQFVLSGAGWGHGVGLCQIGAAVMGEKGCNYREILNHYFRGAVLEKLYH